uniref:CD44 antigen n=1 Tax=Monodelphis domestica TaxID=13616 RepID=A0A5F8GLJ6_MONDO
MAFFIMTPLGLSWIIVLLRIAVIHCPMLLLLHTRFAGVYHVEKNGRYSISRTEAPDLCKAFNSTLPTLEQMERALSIGFETCRYGFIEGHVVIPRKTPRFLCAANNTGVYILASNTSLYDTYCFNASAPLDAENCSSVSDIPSVFEGQVTIGIVNPDGTRYTKKGEYRTNPDDINFNYNQDDDVSSGSAGERSTMGSSTIIQTSYPDVMTTSFNGLRNDDFETSSPAVTSKDNTSFPFSLVKEALSLFSEWLIILSALLALALILAVCIAVNSRRRCGQKKKLVINNGNGAVEDKKTTGVNGDASKSQEMVHLVYKEPSDGQLGQDECMTADETRNLQNVDMKIGV